MKSCLSQRVTKITYCVSCPLCCSIRKIKTSVRWFISPRSRCRTWNRFILPLIPRSCTISYIFFKVIYLTYPETYANISTQCICTKKKLNPVALHMVVSTTISLPADVGFIFTLLVVENMKQTNTEMINDRISKKS